MEERVVLSQSKVRETAEIVGAAEGSVLPCGIGVKAPEREIGQMGMAELNAEFQCVVSANVGQAIGELSLGLVGASAGKSGVA